MLHGIELDTDYKRYSDHNKRGKKMEKNLESAPLKAVQIVQL
jgi:hypothetical protein